MCADLSLVRSVRLTGGGQWVLLTVMKDLNRDTVADSSMMCNIIDLYFCLLYFLSPHISLYTAFI